MRMRYGLVWCSVGAVGFRGADGVVCKAVVEL